jgi:hypothetical protein
MIYCLLSLNRSFLLVMKSEIIFQNFSYIWLRFLSLSIYSRCLAVRERIWSTGDLFFWISFNQIRVAPQSEHFTPHTIPQAAELLQNRFAVRASSIRQVVILAKLLRSQSNLRSSQVIKFLQSRILFRKSLNFYNDIRFWITRRLIRRTTNHNHKQKEQRSEERTSDAKNNDLKKL